MRPLAVVVIVTLVGSCVPVPTVAQAHAGNALLIAASAYAFVEANEAECKAYDLTVDDIVEDIGCQGTVKIVTGLTPFVMVAALIGIGLTLQKTMAPTKTSRSR